MWVSGGEVLECNKKRIELATSVGKLGVGREAAGSKRDGEEATSAMSGFRLSGKNGVFQKKLHENWCGEVAEDGLGFREGVGEGMLWASRQRKAEVEEEDGSSGMRSHFSWR